MNYTKFRGVTDFGQPLLSENLEGNLIEYLKWNLLSMGAFVNVRLATSGGYGGNASKLRLSEDHRFSKGQVWEGYHKNWMWESGVDYTTQPISISGVYINGILYPINTTGTYSYNIDYPNGRVIFNRAIPSTSAVTCEFSHHYFDITNADAPWWQKTQANAFRIDDEFLLYGSGGWSVPPELRLQLPAVVVRAMPNIKRVGREIGSFGQWHKQEIQFYLLTQSNNEMHWIHDSIIGQWDNQIAGFDKAAMKVANAFPLTASGTLNSNPKTYPQLIAPTGEGGFYWKTIGFTNFMSYPNNGVKANTSIYAATISGTFEVVTQ